LLLGGVILGLDACPGPSTSTEDGLANGTFSYVCPNPGGSDTACNGADGNIQIPSTIAVGASFSILYTPNAEALDLEGGALESTTPSILGGSAGIFQFVDAGVAGIIVPGQGGVVDFVNVAGEGIKGIAAFDTTSEPGCQQTPPPAPDGGAESAGGGPADFVIPLGRALDLAFDPLDITENPLSGAVTVVAMSSDDTIVSVGPSVLDDAHAFELCGNGVGTAVITVYVPGLASQFLVSVEWP